MNIITPDTVLKRLNRNLSEKNMIVRKSRGESAFQKWGEYFVTERGTNRMQGAGLSAAYLIEWAREEGLLATDEFISMNGKAA